MLHKAYLHCRLTRFKRCLEDLERQIFRGLIVGVLFVFEVIPNIAHFACVQVRMQMDFKWGSLGDALFLPDKEPVEQQQEIVQIACNVEGCSPLDEANVFWILTTHHKLVS